MATYISTLPSIKSLNTDIYEGRTESHEQLFFFLHANWEQQTKENAVVDETSCCVILECPVTSIACITWLVSLLTKWPTTICHFASVLSSTCCRNSPQTSACLWKCVCMGASSVRRWWNKAGIAYISFLLTVINTANLQFKTKNQTITTAYCA